LNEFISMRDLLTKEELAELLPSPREAEDHLQQPAFGNRSSSLLEQTINYWEQTVHDLQMEVRELRNRIDRLEHRQEDVKPSSLPVVFEHVPNEVQEERLSRRDRHNRGRWF
jgi:hypothetical protein